MTVNKLKALINVVYTELAALVVSGKLTEADKTALGAEIIRALLALDCLEG